MPDAKHQDEQLHFLPAFFSTNQNPPTRLPDTAVTASILGSIPA